MTNKEIIEEFKKEFITNGKLSSKTDSEGESYVVMPTDKRYAEWILEWIDERFSQQKQEFKRVIEGMEKVEANWKSGFKDKQIRGDDNIFHAGKRIALTDILKAIYEPKRDTKNKN